jgi:protein tyrosine/serine phosphatase
VGKKYNMAVTGIVIAILAFWSGLSFLFCEWQGPHSDILLSASSHEWAVPIEKPGLSNFHHVSDDLYRGAQPTAEGFRQLQAMGVKTVINLRFFHSDRELITGTDLDYEEIPMNTWHAEDEDVVRFLTLVSDKSRAPFFVHCQHGADRTGMMCAVYRIVIQGWTRDEAIKEMTSGRFGFHEIWSNLVAYLQKFDLENLKQQAFNRFHHQ